MAKVIRRIITDHTVSVGIFIMAFLFVMPATLTAQKITPTWGVEFSSVFDNREGSHEDTPTMTYFFTRLAPEVGLRFSDESRISGGVIWTQPMGGSWSDYKLRPTLYYRFESPVWRFSMGFFPRHQLTEELPRFLMSDSLSYYERNIQGALVQYTHSNGWAEAFIDWTGMQSATRREAFKIVAQGKWHPKKNNFFGGLHLMMNHYALSAGSPSDQHIVDNFLVSPHVGIELGRPVSFLDSLNVKLGYVLTVERNRACDDGWRTPGGGWFQLMAQWRWLRLENFLYAGGRLLPSYSEFGSALYPGEPFFQRKFYNRTDVYLSLLHRKCVSLEGALDFNFTRGGMIFYQRLMLRVEI